MICPGTGQPPAVIDLDRRHRGHCPVCDRNLRIQTGRIPTHQETQ